MQFKQYQRTNIAEMCQWEPIGGLTHAHEVTQLRVQGISISEADLNNGSPKPGDMIARNPMNHADKWLVAKQYFEENFREYRE